MTVKTKRKKGLLIAFEGIDGTGKSTQIALLARKLRARDLAVVATREPTDGRYGRRIRDLYQSREGVSLEEELQLFLADRREHVASLIAPSLAAGKIVLTDRYYFSTAAYQGAAGLDSSRIISLNEEFAPRPDLVILLDIPVAEGVRRIQDYRQETLNAFEQEDNLVEVDRIFKTMQGDYFRTIDGAQGIEAVHAAVMACVEELLGEGAFV